MRIDKLSIDKLKFADYNPRKDLKPGDPEYEKLKKSIEHFGYVEPVIVNDRTGLVVGGHQRVKVLKDLGYTDIEVVHVDLDDANEKALNIALNKISGDWDAEKLEDLLREINVDTDLDVMLTGFDASELDTLFNGSLEEQLEDDDSEQVDDGNDFDNSVEFDAIIIDVTIKHNKDTVAVASVKATDEIVDVISKVVHKTSTIGEITKLINNINNAYINGGECNEC